MVYFQFMDERGAVLSCAMFVNALQLGSMELLSVSMKATYATFEMKAIKQYFHVILFI